MAANQNDLSNSQERLMHFVQSNANESDTHYRLSKRYVNSIHKISSRKIVVMLRTCTKN